MKAIIRYQYGSPDVLKLEEVPKPTPSDDDVLIKVQAASVNAADWHVLRGDPAIARLVLGLLTPKIKILGADVAGQVEAVGKNVTEFKPGDEVFGDISGCGFGAFAEYARARADVLVAKPASITFEQAAALPLAAVTALQGLQKGRIQAGHRVLILGASGGAGSFAVQIAKSFGAHVTAVCSTNKLAMVRTLGADQVIDSAKDDGISNGQQYDIIFDAAAFRSIVDFVPALTTTGTYVLIGGSTAQLLQILWRAPLLSKKGGKTFSSLMAHPNKADLTLVTELVAAGKVKPIIDRTYSLAEVPQAIAHLEQRLTKGKVVIKM